MKVCFVCSEYPPAPHGGIGTVTQILARALVRNGHSVKVIGASNDGSLPDYEADQGVEVWRMPVRRHRCGWMRTRYQIFSRISTWVRNREVDLVEAPDWEGWSAGWPKLPVPVIIRLHGSSSYFSQELGGQARKSTFWIERAALRRCDFYCSVSRYTAEKTRLLFGLMAEPSAVIYNSVAVGEPIRNSVKSRNRVIFTGTLTAKKGIVSLAQAWPVVKQNHPEAELHIFGKDGLAENGTSMREFVSSNFLRDHMASVHFHGHQPRAQVLDHLRSARVAIFPSYAEAFAMAPLEAMAEGCATIYSRMGSGPELIEHGRDGLLIDPAKPADIVASLCAILENDALAETLGNAGRERVRENFCSERILQMNEDFYGICMSEFLNRARKN
jgi:glycosyltransferase involved in cell wall biosynthesis